MTIDTYRALFSNSIRFGKVSSSLMRKAFRAFHGRVNLQRTKSSVKPSQSVKVLKNEIKMLVCAKKLGAKVSSEDVVMLARSWVSMCASEITDANLVPECQRGF